MTAPETMVAALRQASMDLSEVLESLEVVYVPVVLYLQNVQSAVAVARQEGLSPKEKAKSGCPLRNVRRSSTDLVIAQDGSASSLTTPQSASGGATLSMHTPG